MQSSLFFFTELPTPRITKTKKSKDRSRYKISHRSQSSILPDIFYHLSGFSLISWPYQPKYKPARMSYISPHRLKEFSDQDAKAWFDRLSERDKPYAINDVLNLCLQRLSHFGAPAEQLDHQETSPSPATLWLSFAMKHTDKITVDFPSLHYAPTDILMLLLPKLSSQSLADIASITVETGRVSLAKEVFARLPTKQLLSQNSRLLQKLCDLRNPVQQQEMMSILIPLSSWKAASRTLVDRKDDSVDILLAHPCVPSSELAGILDFARIKGLDLPKARAKYEKHLLGYSVHQMVKEKELVQKTSKRAM